MHVLTDFHKLINVELDNVLRTFVHISDMTDTKHMFL